jgi:hypothetical protein
MQFSAPPDVPIPVFDDDDDALPTGDVVVLPFMEGAPFTLRFGGSYESFLCLAGERLVEPTTLPGRHLLIWTHRLLAPLYRVLGDRHGLCGVVLDGAVQLRDIVDLDTQRFLDHSAVRRVLGGTALDLPPFAALGEIGSAAELMSRARAMFAAGASLEVRVEDDGHVAARRRLRVAR